MDALYITVALVLAVFASSHAWKFLNWAWLQPRKKEKQLRHLGFRGNKYRFLIGDYLEISSKAKEVQSKPITSFSNDITERALGFIHQSIQIHGENCFLWFGPTPAVMVSDPDMIKEVLSKNYVFQKVVSATDKLLAQGVATHEKDKWAKHRRIINPAFHLEKLKNMIPSFYLSCGDVLSKWEEIVAGEEESREVDVWPHLETLTSDAISRTAFGSNYEEGRKIFELQNEQVALLMQSLETILIPGWRFLPTKVNKRMRELSQKVESSILEIIHKRQQQIEAGETSSDDLLGILLESNMREMQENGNESGMNLQDVVEECKVFYIVGQVTTASLLAWTMILLSKHLDWQARAREEALEVLKSDTIPNFQELNHLKVINMILHEVLRLYPPITMLSRAAHEETTLGNLKLPGGVWLFMPTIMLHHDSDVWGDDAKEFKPERFSEGVSKATKGQLSYFPFGCGPRTCLGQNFAMLEAKMALAMILRRYAFEVSPSYVHAPESVMTLEPQHGAQLILRRIN